MSARILVLAGHDPSGGAGVAADRIAARHFGVEAECVITAWTEQDGIHVQKLEPRPVAEWLEEARYALAAPIGALKSGLLTGSTDLRALASLIDELGRIRPVPVVVDPVLAASGGELFLDAESIATMLAEVLPRGVILTPNLPEAARLAGLEPRALEERDARVEAARGMLARGARAVLLKGGHASGPEVADLVLERDAEPRWLVRPRVAGARLHGSGCRYASAVAAQLARGTELAQAAEAAGRWLGELLRART